MSDAERSRSRSGSVSSGSSFLSTKSAKQVAMNKVYKTSDKKMRIAGVNGCTSIHLFGAGFIVGAHAEPGKIPAIAQKAAVEAGKGVTSIVVWAPDESDGNIAVTALRAHYPQAQINRHSYDEKESETGWWEFEASQGNPGVVSPKYDPGN